MNQNKKILIALLCCIAPHIYGAGFASLNLSTSDFVQKVAQLAIQTKNLRDAAEKLKTNGNVIVSAQAELQKLQDQAETRTKLDAAALKAQERAFTEEQKKQKENFEAEQRARQAAFEEEQAQRKSEFEANLDEQLKKYMAFGTEQTKKCTVLEGILRKTQEEQEQYENQADLLKPVCKTDYAKLVAAILEADATVSESYFSRITYAKEHDREAIEHFKQLKHKAPERKGLQEASDALRALYKQSSDIFEGIDISNLPSPRGEDEEVQTTMALVPTEKPQTLLEASATFIASFGKLPSWNFGRPGSRIVSSLLEEEEK